MMKYRATIMMAVVAIVFLFLHLWLGWEAAVEEAATHGTSETWSAYLVEWARDTFENLQSEFWQLAVQFALLAGLFEFMAVKAYEKDEEEMKEQLDRIERLLQERQHDVV
ncbi:MAG TPA: DUF6766 family protein [Thermomicrobiales bacterium]|nr:DUF6766 family protein [Thermomicrobiales bacterium]